MSRDHDDNDRGAAGPDAARLTAAASSELRAGSTNAPPEVAGRNSAPEATGPEPRAEGVRRRGRGGSRRRSASSRSEAADQNQGSTEIMASTTNAVAGEDDRGGRDPADASAVVAGAEGTAAGAAGEPPDDAAPQAEEKRRRRGRRGGRRHRSHTGGSANGQLPQTGELIPPEPGLAAQPDDSGGARIAEQPGVAAPMAMAAETVQLAAATAPIAANAAGVAVESPAAADATSAADDGEAGKGGRRRRGRRGSGSRKRTSLPGDAGAAGETAGDERPASEAETATTAETRRPSGPASAAEAATEGLPAQPGGDELEKATKASRAPRSSRRSRPRRRTSAESAPEAQPEGAAAIVEGRVEPPTTTDAGQKGPADVTAATEEIAAPAPSGIETGADRAESIQPQAVAAADESTAVEQDQKRRRRGRRKKAEAPAQAETSESADDAAPAAADAVRATTATTAQPAETAAPVKEKRRRRRRGGQADADADAQADKRADQGEDEERSQAWTSSRRRRRPVGAPPREERDRVILATEGPDELRVAVVEDERLAEVYLQRTERPSILGNIYQARVQNVLRGMDAAFVDFGLEKSGFLHVDEVEVPDSGPRRSRRITQLLQPGQEIMVQITKDPMKGKGARLTTRVTLAGRYVVYVPGGSGVGVSRRLSQEERDRLRDVCKSLRIRKAGLIVRTVAEGKGVDELRRDVQYLSRQWSRIKAKAEKKTAPALVHEEVDVALEVARDLFDDSYRSYIVDSPKVHKRLMTYLTRVAPELVSKVELYKDGVPLFEAHGVEDGIEATLARRVPLPSGGNLVIDHTEALTVIDVNSGRYTGGSGLEETITRTNLDAATEVVRQLRLRDIGGIIVIDFIDMARRENRAAVLARLEHELALDRTKSYVVEISPLGLVEMTRQSTTEGTRGLLTTVCPTCHATGRVLSPDTMCRDVERSLRRQLPQLRGEAVLVEVQRAVADRLERSETMRRLERETGRRVFFEGSSLLPVDSMAIVASGSLAEIEAQRLPVREGEEMEVEIRHGLPFSPNDAVAIVGGYQLVVRGGRRFVGTLKRVRVETAQRHGGLAVLVGGGRN